MFTDNLTASNRYGWVHKSVTRFISSSSLETSNLGWGMLYGLQSVMHDQAMYHAWLLSVYHAVNCQTSCSQLHFSNSQCSHSKGERKTVRHHYFHDLLMYPFLCTLSSIRKELHSCTEQARDLCILVYGLANLDWNMKKSSLANKYIELNDAKLIWNPLNDNLMCTSWQEMVWWQSQLFEVYPKML